MKTERTFRRMVMMMAMLAALCSSGAVEVVAQPVEIYHYKDVLRPSGRARTMAQKQADIRACGGPYTSAEDSPRTVACMNAHGWAIDHVVPPRVASAYAGRYDRTVVPANPSNLSNAADFFACEPGGLRNPRPVNDPVVANCLLGRGWHWGQVPDFPCVAVACP